MPQRQDSGGPQNLDPGPPRQVNPHPKSVLSKATLCLAQRILGGWGERSHKHPSLKRADSIMGDYTRGPWGVQPAWGTSPPDTCSVGMGRLLEPPLGHANLPVPRQALTPGLWGGGRRLRQLTKRASGTVPGAHATPLSDLPSAPTPPPATWPLCWGAQHRCYGGGSGEAAAG